MASADNQAAKVEHLSEEEQQRLGIVSLEEDRLPVPTSVTQQQIADAARALGIDPDQSSLIEIGTHWIRVLVRIAGTKYPKGLMDAGILVPGTLVEIPLKDDDA